MRKGWRPSLLVSKVLFDKSRLNRSETVLLVEALGRKCRWVDVEETKHIENVFVTSNKKLNSIFLFLIASSKAPVTTSDALVPSSYNIFSI